MNDGYMVVFPQRGLEQDWVANIRANPQVSVYSGETRWNGTAALERASGTKDPILGAFTRKYGEAEVKRRYWGQLNFFKIELKSERREDYYDLLYSDLETAFDGVADSYDEHILGNAMNVWLRNRSLALMMRIFKPGDVVVEIGCGTGTETLTLAKQGVKVLASDISSKMLGVLQRKAEEEGLQRMVIPIHCRPYEILQRAHEAGYDSVDGAYSTYGAINTDPRLKELLSALHSLIKGDGVLILGVWNRFCLYEMLGYTMRLKPSLSLARLRNPVPVGKSRFCVTTSSFSVGSMDSVVGPWFKRTETLGVEILLPPSNLVRYLPPKVLLDLVKRAEVALEPAFPWNRLGDHFLGVYHRIG